MPRFIASNVSVALIQHADIESSTCVVEWISFTNSGIVDDTVILPFTNVQPICEFHPNARQSPNRFHPFYTLEKQDFVNIIENKKTI